MAVWKLQVDHALIKIADPAFIPGFWAGISQNGSSPDPGSNFLISQATFEILDASLAVIASAIDQMSIWARFVSGALVYYSTRVLVLTRGAIQQAPAAAAYDAFKTLSLEWDDVAGTIVAANQLSSLIATMPATDPFSWRVTLKYFSPVTGPFGTNFQFLNTAKSAHKNYQFAKDGLVQEANTFTTNFDLFAITIPDGSIQNSRLELRDSVAGPGNTQGEAKNIASPITVSGAQLDCDMDHFEQRILAFESSSVVRYAKFQPGSFPGWTTAVETGRGVSVEKAPTGRAKIRVGSTDALVTVPD
jgi:hypothetical protein